MATANKKYHPQPVMRITRYDRVSAWMTSVILACFVGAIIFFIMWYSNRIPEPEGK
ncbi:MAG: hypothetical protein R3C11_04160 [Planctomycetaceae bacterium]